MLKLKKLLALVLSVATMFAVNVTAFAAEKDAQSVSSGIVSSDGEVYIGVSPKEPSDIHLDSVDIPWDAWNIEEDGQYDFAGKSYSQNLYTNYKFTGKDEYTVKVVNEGDEELTVKVKTEFKTYDTHKVAPHRTAEYSVNIKSSTKFYILFKGKNQDFSGYIK